MRKAHVFVNGIAAGLLTELQPGGLYTFDYSDTYQARPVSLTMPLTARHYQFENFPPFFEGLLPEGPQLEALLRFAKLDRDDYFGQLLAVGNDLVGSITVVGLDE